MQPLKNVLPPSDRVLYVFYDFEKTQNTRYSDTAIVHVPNLVRIQQFCSRCECTDDVGKFVSNTVRGNTLFGRIL
jgi:hypothetical protein